MRPGIILQHARERSSDTSLVRSDVTGFIGIVTRDRWPGGAEAGDFFELALSNYSDLMAHPARHFYDPVTRRAVRSFFENGGQTCVLFGLCLESEQDLLTNDPFDVSFFALMDRLRGQEDIGILVMPVLAYLPYTIDERGRVNLPYEPVIKLLLTHCEEMNNRFLILDTPRDLHDLPLTRWVRGFRERVATVACFGALYYPWLMVGDETIPPSGCMAGLYARVDREHGPFGVHWPPANEEIRGVTHPSVEVRHSEAGDLNELGINPILSQPARGVVVWGARTLSQDRRWLHINSRRVVSFISEQLRRDSEWAVFENQRQELWQIIGRMVTSRLDQLWSAGLLAGDRAGSEYMVQCDRETNPPELVDAGYLNVRVMLRPISTAESIVVELRLGSGGSSVGSV